jgi:hypothetical protein
MRRLILAAGILALPLVSANAADPAKTATLYKNPQCSCCEDYANYLRRNGYTVTVKPTHDLSLMNRQAGVPNTLEGCHLTMIDGYVVEGHVPVNALNRLLSEKPNIKGISLPGMPMGSPGMTGRKTGPFTIYEIGGDPSRVYAVE